MLGIMPSAGHVAPVAKVWSSTLAIRLRLRDEVAQVLTCNMVKGLLRIRADLGNGPDANVARELYRVTLVQLQGLQHAWMLRQRPYFADLGSDVRFPRAQLCAGTRGRIRSGRREGGGWASSNVQRRGGRGIRAGGREVAARRSDLVATVVSVGVLGSLW